MHTRLIEQFSSVTGTLLNLILIPIIIKQSSPKMGRYKYLLLSYTAVACYFAFCVSTNLYTWYLPQNGFLFLSTVYLLPRWIQSFQLNTLAGTYVLTVTIINLSFIYRLNSLNDGSAGKAKFCYYLVVLFGIANFIGFVTVVGVFLAPSAETDALFQEEVYNQLGIVLYNVTYCGCFPYMYIAMYQTCFPILFNMLPVGAIIFLALLKAPIGDLPQYCAMVFSFTQVFDPLFTMIFIIEYRRFISKIVRMICRKPTVAGSPGIFLQHTSTS